MIHIVMAVLAAAWLAANFYLWSMKQSHEELFWESLGVAAVAYPVMFWYVMRRND
jgi:hypothetical protein